MGKLSYSHGLEAPIIVQQWYALVDRAGKMPVIRREKIGAHSSCAKLVPPDREQRV